MAGRLYDKRQWRRLREQQLRMHPLCVMCMKRGLATPAQDVDHIKPLADGGERFAHDNLRSLCHSCHSLVTRAAQAGRDVRIKGCATDGTPLDPNHAWNRAR